MLSHDMSWGLGTSAWGASGVGSGDWSSKVVYFLTFVSHSFASSSVFFDEAA